MPRKPRVRRLELAAERLEDRRLLALAPLPSGGGILQGLADAVAANNHAHIAAGLRPVSSFVTAVTAAPSGTSRTNAVVSTKTNTTFNVTTTGFTADAERAFLFATRTWADLIRSPVPIAVAANFTPMNDNALGGAVPADIKQDFKNAGIRSTWYPIALANALSGQDLSPTEPDIKASFNSTQNWYFGTDGNVPPDRTSFASVALHELGHGLGFGITTMTVDAKGQGSWGLTTGVPTVFDRFVENGSGQRLLDTTRFPNPSATLGAQLKSQNVFFNAPNAKAANRGDRVRLYAPATWEQGSSIGHVDPSGTGSSSILMVPDLGTGSAILQPGPIDLAILKDLGWTIVAAPQPVVPSLAITATTGDRPEGNDGFTAFTFTVTRSGNTAPVSSARWTVTGGGQTPADGVDFVDGVLPTGVVTFAAGETSKSVTVAVRGDSAVEPDERFAVTLSSPVNATIAGPTAAGVIRNDDPTAPSAPAVALGAWVADGATRADATQASGVVTVIGERNSTVFVTFVGSTNGAGDPNKAVKKTVAGRGPGAAVPVTLTNTDLATLTDGRVDVVVAQLNAARKWSPSTVISFILDTLAPAAPLVVLNAAVVDGATRAEATHPSGVVTVTGERNSTVYVTFVGSTNGASDPKKNVTKTVAGRGPGAAVPVTLTDADLATLSDGRVEVFAAQLDAPGNWGPMNAVSFMLDQRPAPSLAITAFDADKSEGNSGSTIFAFTITRSGNAATASSVRWSIAGGGSGVAPTDAADFVNGTVPGGVVVFEAGQTSKSVTVPVAGDTAVEGDEAFTVTLADATNATIAVGAATAIVRNDDPVVVGSRIVREGAVPHGMREERALFGVRLTDANGRPLANQRITFTASAAIFSEPQQLGTRVTDRDGKASIRYLIPKNPLADEITLTAEFVGTTTIRGSSHPERVQIGRPR